MNKNTKVLALKYRPQTFDDLIGQDVVAETISNSIKANKVPNAYLFTGIRGIGKTTTARIVAKSLNCSNGIDNLCKENFFENSLLKLNSNKAKKILNWKCNLSSKDSIKLTIDWYKQFSLKKNILNLSKQQIEYFTTK